MLIYNKNLEYLYSFWVDNLKHINLDGLLNLLEANKNDTTAGIHSVDPDFNKAVEKIHEGFKFISYSLDSILLKNSMELGINNIKKNI